MVLSCFNWVLGSQTVLFQSVVLSCFNCFSVHRSYFRVWSFPGFWVHRSYFRVWSCLVLTVFWVHRLSSFRVWSCRIQSVILFSWGSGRVPAMCRVWSCSHCVQNVSLSSSECVLVQLGLSVCSGHVQSVFLSCTVCVLVMCRVCSCSHYFYNVFLFSWHLGCVLVMYTVCSCSRLCSEPALLFAFFLFLLVMGRTCFLLCCSFSCCRYTLLGDHGSRGRTG